MSSFDSLCDMPGVVVLGFRLVTSCFRLEVSPPYFTLPVFVFIEVQKVFTGTTFIARAVSHA